MLDATKLDIILGTNSEKEVYNYLIDKWYSIE